MAEALRLARLGLYSTDPNPRVGCVVVKDGQIVGRGWHKQAGTPHAEVHALNGAGDDAKGATAYVTLEPCSHTGRTPPCANALIKAGVARVVAAMQDPNPLVAGSGFKLLQAAGISVAFGLMQAEAEALNPGFIKRMVEGRPFVRIKLASSLDGRTAMASGESQWITGPAARADVQKLRARSSAVITGIGTVLADDPKLTVRDTSLAPEGLALRQPLRVVLDRQARLPEDCQLLRVDGPLWWVTQTEQPELAGKIASRIGSRHLHLSAPEPRFLTELMTQLAQAQCNEVLVEAGPTLAAAFLRARLCDELIVYMAPKLLGSSARPLLTMDLSAMSEAVSLQMTDIRQVGADLRMTYRPVYATSNL